MQNAAAAPSADSGRHLAAPTKHPYTDQRITSTGEGADAGVMQMQMWCRSDADTDAHTAAGACARPGDTLYIYMYM